MQSLRSPCRRRPATDRPTTTGWCTVLWPNPAPATVRAEEEADRAQGVPCAPYANPIERSWLRSRESRRQPTVAPYSSGEIVPPIPSPYDDCVAPLPRPHPTTRQDPSG